LHEAFRVIDEDEDTTILRKCFLNYILDDSREIGLIMNRNLDVMVLKYGNRHTIENFKGRTPYVENSNSDEGSDDGGQIV